MTGKASVVREGRYGGMEARAGVRFGLAGTAFLDAFGSVLAPLALSPSRVLALGVIRGSPGCGQGALGRALGIRKAAAMGVAERLERDGFIERRAAQDRRVRALFLTPAGEAACAEAEARASAIEAAAFGWLEAAERDTLLATLDEVKRRCDQWRKREEDHG